jgi:hypothetical protein
MRPSGFLSVALVSAVAVLGPAGGGGLRPLHLTSPRVQAKKPLALVWQGNGDRLAFLNPRTLDAGKRRLRVGWVGAWAFERPNGGVLAVASSPSTTSGQPADAIRFVDVSGLRFLPGRVSFGEPVIVRALRWSRPDTLVAVVSKCCRYEESLVDAIDLDTHRVVATTPIAGAVVAIRAAGDGLALLEAPSNAIGPATLTVVSASGDVRSTPLSEVSAGNVADGVASTHRIPGFAVDAAGDRAFVVQADGPAAEIELSTLTVAYHRLTAPPSLLARFSGWLTPQAQAKGGTGPVREAVWLGNDLLAFTGIDEKEFVRPDGGLEFDSAPAGLTIVDTRDWTVRMLDRRADAVTVSRGLLLATAYRSSGKHNIGLAAYGPNRKLRFALFRPWAVDIVAALAGRAYVNTYNVTGTADVSVVNLATGHVIGKRRSQLPTPVLFDGPGLQ